MANQPTNLNEYYTGQGQALPTVQQRQDVATKAGITGYIGTAEQNGTLLGYLTGLPANKGTSTKPPITADSLTNTQTPVVIPPAIDNTKQNSDMNNTVTGLLNSTKSELEKNQQLQDQQTADIAKTIASNGDQTANNAIYATQGVDAKKKVVDSLTSSIEQEQKTLMDTITEIRKNTNGLSAGAINAEINRVQTDSAVRQGNLGIALSASSRDYATATSIAQRMVENNTAQQKSQLESKMFVLQQLGTKIATQQSQAFQLQVKQLDNQESMLKYAIDNAQTASKDGTVDGEVAFKATQDLLSGKISISDFNTQIGNVNDKTGIIDGIDITRYATDPQHELKVQAIYDSLPPDLGDAKSIDGVLKSIAPNTKITGQMIMDSASKYGVSPKLLISLMQQDSSLGTKGLGASNNNPGNIAQYDNIKGAVKGYSTLADGVDAVAKWMSGNKSKAVYRGQYASTIDTAKSLEPASVQAKYKQELQKLVANGDYTTAYQRIQNSVSKSLTGENKTTFVAKQDAIPAIDDLVTKLKAYEDAKGKTGLLKGKFEDIVASLGNVSDPKYKALATDLKISLQAYRQQMSGAAFSPQEAKDYASVNPQGTNKLELNLAILDGMRSNFKRTVDSTVDAQIGVGAKNIRNSIPYQGLNPTQAIVKYGQINPAQQQMIIELKQAGASDALIASKLGLPITQ
jgi:hypothetical protein